MEKFSKVWHHWWNWWLHEEPQQIQRAWLGYSTSSLSTSLQFYNTQISRCVSFTACMIHSQKPGYFIPSQSHVGHTPFEVMYGRQSNSITNPLFCSSPLQSDSDKGEEDGYILQVVRVLIQTDMKFFYAFNTNIYLHLLFIFDRKLVPHQVMKSRRL